MTAPRIIQKTKTRKIDQETVRIGAVRERQILYSGPMVRATLDGMKTKTRRIVKPQPEFGVSPISIDVWEPGVTAFNLGEFGIYREGWPVSGRWGLAGVLRCPYGQPGDRLWVRETWFCDPHEEQIVNDPRAVHYKADYDGDDIAFGIDPERPHIPRRLKEHGGWRPSIFMPRWASRITLEIVSVRVERLHDITEEDAIAEGIQNLGPRKFGIGGWDEYCETAVDAFKILWESINGPGSWAANPWVWVVEFRKLEK